MNKTILVVVVTWVLVLFSGYIEVNVDHHLNLPKEILNRNTIVSSYEPTTVFPFVHKVTDIYLVDEIKTYKQTQEVIETLNNANRFTQVKIHLAGYGGGVEQVMRIINAMKTTKADVWTIVEAPVYSGHAYLALYGKTLVVEPYAYIMLHTSSAVNQDCNGEAGTDRGETNVQHCQNFMTAHMTLVNQMIQNLPGLSQEQKFSLMSGKDLYLINTYDATIVFKNGVFNEQIQ